MRLDSNYVRLHIVNELEKTPYAKVRYDDFDVIVVDLHHGQTAAINIMEREMPLRDLIRIYEDHQRQNIHTVFVLWCEMLIPEHGEIFEPPEWLEALHALHHNKIYAYKTVGDEVYIFPVTLTPIGLGHERLVKYGKLIDVKDLSCAYIEITGDQINGKWRMADFVVGTGRANAERYYKAHIDSDAERRKRRERFRKRYEHTHQTSREQSHTNEILIHYRTLGLTQDADLESIKKAYRQKARLYHPDLNKAPDATHKMQELNAAYAILMQQFEIV